ncbi:hypothetical protein DFJ77DRAFT_125363 [Powellomyces hirtus]|nr:hypothetical protein DFJ77DRAFT_125363 [Powellomyces hirtus]
MLLRLVSFACVAVCAVHAAPLRSLPRDDYSPIAAARECGPVPDFVTNYAPVLYLESQDNYYMTDPIDLFSHVTVLNDAGGKVAGPTPLSPSNLDQYPGGSTYLTSNDNPETNPAWQHGLPPDAATQRSPSPATVVITPPQGPEGTVDVHYMFFYAFNRGPKVLGRHYGSHVGDWESVTIRFAKAGTPSQMWYSQHSGGEAVAFSAVEKTRDGKPIVYVARGSHANYINNGVNGDHPYALPFGILKDITSNPAGGAKILDVAKNYRAYCYGPSSSNRDTNVFTPAPSTDVQDVAWLNFRGRWGDKQYPKSDKRQYSFAGQWHYVDGPTGPVMKNLIRPDICAKLTNAGCEVQSRNFVKEMPEYALPREYPDWGANTSA